MTPNTAYIADGHHRSAAANRVRTASHTTAPLPHMILRKGVLSAIFPYFELVVIPEPGDPPATEFDMYLVDQWHRATPKYDPTADGHKDPVRA